MSSKHETFPRLEYSVEPGGDDAIFALQRVAQGSDDGDDCLFTHYRVQPDVFREYES